MYIIERTDYGMKHTFQGVLDEKEMKMWLQDSQQILKTVDQQFNIVVDMREIKPLGHQVEEILYQGTKMMGELGLNRGAVVLEDPVVFRQMRQIAKYANLQKKERYIDTFTTKNWEKLASDWVEKGIDPDNPTRTV